MHDVPHFPGGLPLPDLWPLIDQNVTLSIKGVIK